MAASMAEVGDHPGPTSPRWHALAVEEVEAALGTSPHGLPVAAAAARLAEAGPNALPEEPPPGALLLLLRQFSSTFILILVAAAVVTLVMGELLDTAYAASDRFLDGETDEAAPLPAGDRPQGSAETEVAR